MTRKKFFLTIYKLTKLLPKATIDLDVGAVDDRTSWVDIHCDKRNISLQYFHRTAQWYLYLDGRAGYCEKANERYKQGRILLKRIEQIYEKTVT